MSMGSNKQVTLKPQDLLVALKIFCKRQQSFTYIELAKELGMSASEVHAAARRAEISRLVYKTDTGPQAAVVSLREFLVHGVRYAFPAVTGSLTRGMPTGFAGPVLRDRFRIGEELIPVWPDPEGDSRGISTQPLYHSVPTACRNDEQLYVLLCLLDALRGGTARDREIAQEVLMERLR